MSLIRCEDVTFSYENQMILSHISFSLEQGNYLCIVGENGSGKTTLLKGLVGLKKPVAGTIFMEPQIKREGIGYIPQQTLIQRDFPASVLEVVLSGYLKYARENKANAMKEMKFLGIDGIAKKSYQELSGGQQQRVLLARALCATKTILFLDEPMAGLDPLATAEFYELLKELNEEKKISIVMVSHAVKEAIAYADHILHLSHDGYFFGTIDEYRGNTIGQLFLGGGNV